MPIARRQPVPSAPSGVTRAGGRLVPTTSPRGARWLRSTALLTICGVLVCGLVMLAGYAVKVRCVGPTFNQAGRSTPDFRIRLNRDLCYSDIQQMWLGRDINEHVFPYINGGISATNHLTGGSIEYPVLTGLAMWASAIGAHNDGQFLAHGALLLAAFGLLTALLLFVMAGRRAWWYALAPPLAWYAFLSWDLLAVACTTAGLAAMLCPPQHWSPRRRALVAAAIFGIGGATKFYPLMFVAPIALWLAAGPSTDPRTVCARVYARAAGPHADPGTARPQRPAADVKGALLVLAVAVGTFAVINVPFAVLGFRGWWASFQFQWRRPIDITTNSIWYWATRPHSGSSNVDLQHLLDRVSMLATAVAMAAVLAAGWWRTRARGPFPWLSVSAALLSAYLLLNKVNSPQYALWLLPFFVLLRIRAGWILAYFAADLAMGAGWLRWQYLLMTGQPSSITDAVPAQLVMIGVWGRAALLLGLIFAFLGASPAASVGPLASVRVDRDARVAA